MDKESTVLFVEGLKNTGTDFVAYLPESYLYDAYLKLKDEKSIEAVAVESETTGISICAGAWLGGRSPAMVMENSGLYQACLPITKLAIGHGIPLLLLMGYRGEIGDENYWTMPHAASPRLLDALRIPYLVVRAREEIQPFLSKARATFNASKYPVAVLFSGEALR